MFSCRTCKKEDFLFEQMKKERRLVETGKGVCKPCSSKYEALRAMVKKANRTPENYMSCDDCDKIFSKYQTSRPLFKERFFQKLRIECPFCKSENIDGY